MSTPPDLRPGTTAVCGGEGVGKTRLLRLWAQQARQAGRTVFWLDPAEALDEPATPRQCFAGWRAQQPRWDDEAVAELADALGLTEHLDKGLFMLSTGSRRKVGLVAGFASGADVVLFDQPFAALDLASIRQVGQWLDEASEGGRRAWVVADYEALPGVRWTQVVDLGDGPAG